MNVTFKVLKGSKSMLQRTEVSLIFLKAIYTFLELHPKCKIDVIKLKPK